MYLVFYILNNNEHFDDLLSAWEESCAPGITILPSTGIGRIRTKNGLRDDIPLFPDILDFDHHEEMIGHSFLSVVPDDETVNRLIQVTESVVGKLSEPNTGIFVVLPTARVVGLDKQKNY